MAFPASVKELHRSRERVMHLKLNGRPPMMVGRKIFEVAHADADAAEIAAWEDTWTHGEVEMDARSVTVKPREGKDGSKDLLVIDYDGFDLSIFAAGRVSISNISAESTTAVSDLTEIEVEGVLLPIRGAPDKDGYVYYVESGAKETKLTTMLRLNTGIPRADFSLEVLGYAGRVNAAGFMGLDAGKVLVLGVEVPRYFLVDQNTKVVPVSYLMGISNEVWLTETRLTRATHEVSYEAVKKYNSAGEWWSDEFWEETYWAPDGIDEVDNPEDAMKRTVIKVRRDMTYGDSATPGVKKILTRTPHTQPFTFLSGLLWW